MTGPETRYIVARGIGGSFEGEWHDYNALPQGPVPVDPNYTVGRVQLGPTGMYEQRDDGEWAEIYRPVGENPKFPSREYLEREGLELQRFADCPTCGLTIRIMVEGQQCLCGTPTGEPYTDWLATGGRDRPTDSPTLSERWKGLS